ncbi:MAG: AAA family ATPase [Neptunomonas phycophila]|uniref:AAA family ATPase n=1 Tax=Neptunomonas phycophila TaxID=1572645 RepID=UPI003B8DD546
MQNFDHTDKFNEIYTEFKQTDLFKAMSEMVENNDWHLEANVGVHTDMVVQQYLDGIDGEMTHEQFLGALACMLHDIGKPVVCEPIEKEDGTIRLTSPGHELESARLAEDFLVRNFNGKFSGVMGPSDITRVCWLIQHHLFYNITNKQKLRDLRTTSRYFVSAQVPDDDKFDDIYVRCITADTLGRIGKDPDLAKAKLAAWVDRFNNVEVKQPTVGLDKPTMAVLIGPSGVGKSTFRNKKLPYMAHFNWDDLRVEKYKEQAIEAGKETEGDIYQYCWEQSCHPTDMGKFSDDFKEYQNDRLKEILDNKIDVVIDNTNLSRKRYADIVQRGRQKGYQVIAVVFPTTIDTLTSRLESRSDRNMDPAIVINMFKRLTLPSLGRWFDGINVWDGNLWEQNISKNLT